MPSFSAHKSSFSVFSPRLLLLAIIILPLLAAGCGKNVLFPQPQSTPPASQPAATGEAALLEQSFRARDFAKAEKLAVAYTGRQNISRSDLAHGLRILALSAVQTRHANTAVSALERWRSVAPGADESEEWRNAWLDAASLLPGAEAERLARQALNDQTRPQAFRWDVAALSARQDWNAADYARALEKLKTVYTSAGGSAQGKAYQAGLERRLFEDLHSLRQHEIDRLASRPGADTASFPYAIVKLEEARRYAMDPLTKPLGQEIVDALVAKNSLAAPDILAQWASLPDSAVPAVLPSSGQVLALALPRSGKFGSFSDRIVMGANIACAEFAAAGVNVRLEVIDTDKPGWEEKLAALPENVRIVGGPLQNYDYTKLKAGGELSKRAFFTFMPRLEGADEGNLAWRFFASPDDQFDALLRFTSVLGVTSYGSFYPEDNYGNRVNEAFAARVKLYSGHITSQGSYPPQQPDTWTQVTAGFLGARKGSGPSGAPYEALLLPGTWEQMDIIVPTLFYYKTNNRILMGTSLWEQGLSAGKHIDAHYYDLAIFPGAWNASNPEPAVEKLRLAVASSGQKEADFWSGLGYDFVRFTAGLNMAPGWTPQTLNAALSANPGIAWSCAPIKWNSAGQASQALFLFTPTGDGFAPVDATGLAEKFNRLRGR